MSERMSQGNTSTVIGREGETDHGFYWGRWDFHFRRSWARPETGLRAIAAMIEALEKFIG